MNPDVDTAQPQIKEEHFASLALPSRYIIEKELARGGMGVVYLGHHQMTKQKLAIKVLHPQNVSDVINIQRFKQEATAAGKLNHPHIVKVIDFGVTDNGLPFMVMEFVEGETLKELLAREKRLDLADFFDIFGQAAEALSHAHKQNVIHRDIKPSNISVSKTDDGKHFVRVLDFGVARVIDEDTASTMTKTGEVIGSPLYMSPEQGLGKKCAGTSDIYSLGCVMYEALSGQPPIGGDNAIETIFNHVNATVPELNERLTTKVPRGLNNLVSRCLLKDPKLRYQSAGDLADELKKIHADPKYSKSYRKSHPRLKALLSLLVLVIIMVAPTALLLYPHFDELVKAVSGQGEQNKLNALKVRADKLADEGKVQEALALYIAVRDNKDCPALQRGDASQKMYEIYLEQGDDVAASKAAMATAENWLKGNFNSRTCVGWLIEAAIRAEAAKDYKLAIPPLREALAVEESHPDTPFGEPKYSTLQRLAVALHYNKQYKEALPVYESALRLMPSLRAKERAQLQEAVREIKLKLESPKAK